MSEATVWSFDLGKASIGEAVRDTKSNEMLHKESLLIPEDFASTKAATSRRRMWRTRNAHKAREDWLDKVWREVGLEPLQKRQVGPNPQTGKWELKHPADARLEREFPKKGDNTCYTSCLLRIQLLRGEKLEPWQIYKALHSAIQRRGYDPDIPWKSKASEDNRNSLQDDEEGPTRERMNAFVEELKKMSPCEAFQMPCYFDAWKMGLWNPSTPDVMRLRIDCTPQSTRDQIVPRWLVEKEIRLLCESASLQIQGLKGKASYLLWGPAEKAYASSTHETRKQFGLRRGGASDWNGVVGQKLPRFDNRIIEKCSLIPRLNVCKIKADGARPLPGSEIIFETTFLMKLKNMRVQRNGSAQTGLTATEIRAIFEDPKITAFKITETQWRKLCEKRLFVRPLVGSEKVDAPRPGGRSRFCRPALDILKRLILSGQTPSDFYREEIVRLNGNADPKRGLVATDLKFLLQMGSTWEGIFIPNQKLEALTQQAENAEDAIRKIIGSQNDPIVRHRLEIFAQRVKKLHSQYGIPEDVVIEFIREDFMGKKAVIEYRAFLKKREGERKRAREEAMELGGTERSAALKLELLREQGGICLYTGNGLFETKLDEYEIEHIVPRAQGGPDAVINYVLTTHAANKEKGNRTPFEWLSKTEAWNAYVERVRARVGALRNKKAKLLLSESAAELAEKYTALAETAWIAKLSRAILDVFFGWKNGVSPDGQKRITVVNGGLTARIRRKYKLNSLLSSDAENEEEAEKKNRADDRHHALDAMVISFIPGWTRDAQKEHFFRLPQGVDREFFKRHINEVTPRNLCLKKAALAETIYGSRGLGSERVIVQRATVLKLAYAVRMMKEVFDLKTASSRIKAIRDNEIRRRLTEFIATEPTESAWRLFCATFTQRGKKGNTGSPIKTVVVDVGDSKEYIEMSKDGSGAWRNGKTHKGYIVYSDQSGKFRVKPVYVFESAQTVMNEIREQGDAITVIDFFQSGCLVELSVPAVHTTNTLPAGQYKLNTLKADGRATLKSSTPTIFKDIPLAKLFAAGFRRPK